MLCRILRGLGVVLRRYVSALTCASMDFTQSFTSDQVVQLACRFGNCTKFGIGPPTDAPLCFTLAAPEILDSSLSTSIAAARLCYSANLPVVGSSLLSAAIPLHDRDASSDQLVVVPQLSLDDCCCGLPCVDESAELSWGPCWPAELATARSYVLPFRKMELPQQQSAPKSCLLTLRSPRDIPANLLFYANA